LSLDDQEQPTSDQDEVAHGKALVENLEQRPRHADDPEDRQKQDDAEDQRQGEADLPGALGLLGRELFRDDREENHIVDAEHDFESAQGDETGPYVRVGQKFHGFPPRWCFRPIRPRSP
jgi:hypothetical protein